MKKSVIIGIIAAVVVIGAWAASAYNSMVGVQEEATTALANVQSAYQRRADLIPNLVETVKGYAQHEQQTLEKDRKQLKETAGLSQTAEVLRKMREDTRNAVKNMRERSQRK